MGLGKAFAIMAAGLACSNATGAEVAVSSPPAEITLAQALAWTLERNPELAATDLDIRIAEAKQLQASLRKNPEAMIEIEDIRWARGPEAVTTTRSMQATGKGMTLTHDRATEQGAAPAFGETQTTIGLSQLIELGGKRVKRMRTAAKEKDLARWDFEAKRLDILTETTQRFVEVLAGQQAIALADENVALAEQVLKVVSAKVEAGRAAPPEINRAETDLGLAKIQREKGLRDLEIARARLVQMWGAHTADFQKVVGDLETITALPTYDDLVAELPKNPDLARWVDEMGQREAALIEQRAQGVPDLTAQAFFRTVGLQNHQQRDVGYGTDGTATFSSGTTGHKSHADNSLVVLFSVPLPIFDRNQGGIKQAEIKAIKAVQEKRKAENQAHADLHAAYSTVTEAYATVDTVKNKLMPLAQDTFEKMQEGYRMGKFGYADVLDSLHNVYNLRSQYVDGLKGYHQAVAGLERLLGKSATSDTKDDTGN